MLDAHVGRVTKPIALACRLVAVCVLWAAATSGMAATLYWTADGSTLGGNGTWNTAAATWSATMNPVVPEVWAHGSDAIFAGAGGSVITIAEPISAATLTFDTTTATLNATATGSLATALATVTDMGFTATINASLTGSNGFAKAGDGLLILGGSGNDYTGTTHLLVGDMQSGASDVIPDASRLSVVRFTSYDFAGSIDTIAGLSGEGSVAIGPSLTLSLVGSGDVRFDGALSGSGDVIIDSAGSGAQHFSTTANTEADKLEKDYTGRTLIRRGTLMVDTTATPTATSDVEVLPGGRLVLATDSGQYTFGDTSATVVTLAGGTLSQAPDTAVLLTNTLDVTADSTLAIANTPVPDPLAPSAEGMLLSGSLTGAAGSTLTITASETTPGADTARVVFASLAGNTYAGTVSPQLNAVARIDGVYDGLHVQLDGGRVDGSGFMKSIAGSGSVAPVGIGSSQGILTAESLTVAPDTSFEFGFSQVNGQPDWFHPDASLNDALRLTGSDPLPVELSRSNTVQLFLQVNELVQDDVFFGGFLTRTDTTSLITAASFETYVMGDGKGVDILHNGAGFYSLASFNALKGIDLEASVSMKQVSASFNGLSKEPAFLMQTVYAEPTGPLVINVASGSTTQAAAGYPLISGTRGLIKTGGGELVLDQANTFTGTTSVDEGMLAVTHTAALASSPTVVAGGQLTIAVDASLPSLSVDTGVVALDASTRRVLGLGSLSIAEDAGGGIVDLGRGRIDVATGGISPADLRADIIAGRNGGGWDGATGITSSVAAADARFGVGYMIDATTGVASMAWAALGDSNLDGLVNFDDILALFPNYNAAGTFTWQQGDFTYDGLVNFDDILALFPNYGAPDYLASGLGGSGLAAAGFGTMADDPLTFFSPSSGAGGMGGVAAVPEPSSLWLTACGLAVLGGLHRRRFRGFDLLKRPD